MARDFFSALCIAALLATAVGCGADGDSRAKKKPANVPPPELPAGVAESSDRAQASLALAFAVAMAQGEGMEQMGMIHPALMVQWTGYGPYPTCAMPRMHKLPDPSEGEINAYLQSKGWGRGGQSFPTVRAWAILDAPCGTATEWNRSAVWITPATGGWRVIRYETDAQWYTGP